ncbi:hypothetical protein FRC04_008140 [Tulasnella sp. 424]|nr:hypothetical protein FRC04_008140 [Tulasnella sp. 424]KAG8959234.1 hypothetical protein FRC05_007979 [Tulasnella sp. 425]
MDSYAQKQESDAVLRQDSSLFAVEADRSGAREVVNSEQPSEGIDCLYAPEGVAEEHFSRRIITREADPNWLVRYFPFVGNLWNRKEGLESEMNDMHERLNRRDWEIAHLRHSLSDRERELGEVNEMRKRLDRRDREITQLRGSLADRERELGEMKKTLCMYDDCSEVDIADMMGGINTRIQSLFRNAAQRWCRGISKGQGGGGDNKFLNETEMETLRRIVGPQLASALGSHPPERNPCIVVLLQLAWQASTVSVVEKILSSFVAGLAISPEGLALDTQLKNISGSVKEGEIQPAYGRWRYVTHQYLKRQIPHDQAVQLYIQEVLHHCRLAARLALRSSCPDDQTFVNTFQPQLTAIIEDAFKLQGSIQEKMLTANYDSYLPANGTPFREDLMEVDKADQVFPKDTVVCTTRLGVTLSRKKGRENLWDVEKEVFLKAQVLTEGNLTDILGSKEEA